MADVWPKLTAVEYKQGDVLKEYDTYTKEVFIIFDGDVDVYSRLQ